MTLRVRVRRGRRWVQVLLAAVPGAALLVATQVPGHTAPKPAAPVAPAPGGLAAPIGGREPVGNSILVATSIPGAHVTLPGGRTYWLCGATGGTTRRPLVVGLTFTSHDAAFLNNAAWVTGNPATTGWCRHAASAGYTLLLGDPVGGAWNVGKGTNDPNPQGWPGSGRDDEGYVLDAVADAGDRTPVDRARIFATGGSAGAAMAWRLAADHPEVFAGCAMAAGWVPYRYPTHRIDCRLDNGTADLTVPIRGGVGIDHYHFPPAYDAMVRAPRGSRVALYATTANHAIPGWWAAAVWTFVTMDVTSP